MSSAAPPLRQHASDVRPSRGMHRLPVLAAVVGVLLVHAWLLSSVPGRDGAGLAPGPPVPPAGPRPPAALQTRAVVLQAAAVALPPVVPAPSEFEQLPAKVPEQVSEQVSEQVPAQTLPHVRGPRAEVGERPPPAAGPVPIGLAGTTGAAAQATSTSAVAASMEGAEVPTYRTRLPPPARLAYALQRVSARGAAHGTGELVWAPADAAYTLSLQGSASGAPLIGWDSRGGFDAAGIAPERFLDSRRGRDAQAANFRRDGGRITFSGPATELPLAPGTQDRLTWMLQLPAIVDAGPARFEPGAQIAMWVVSARGDLGVWTFVVEARETIDVPAGSVDGALRLTREPRQPYDTRVEVWLDPARHHLPARLRMSIPQTGDMTELLLHDARLR